MFDVSTCLMDAWIFFVFVQVVIHHVLIWIVLIIFNFSLLVQSGSFISDQLVALTVAMEELLIRLELWWRLLHEFRKAFASYIALVWICGIDVSFAVYDHCGQKRAISLQTSVGLQVLHLCVTLALIHLSFIFNWVGSNLLPQLRRLFQRFWIKGLSCMLKWSHSSFEGRCQIHISRNNAPGEKTQHPIANVILCNRWWICKGIVSEILWEDSLREEHFVGPSGANTKLFELNIANTALTAAVLEQIRLG